MGEKGARMSLNDNCAVNGGVTVGVINCSVCHTVHPGPHPNWYNRVYQSPVYSLLYLLMA